MSCLKMLAVGVTVLSLCQSVTSVSPFKTQYNMRMTQCNFANRSAVDDLDLNAMTGLWYLSHFSVAPGDRTQYTGVKFNIHKVVSPVVNNRGEANQDFMVIVPKWTVPGGSQCSSGTWLYEVNGFNWAYQYFTFYLSVPPSYYIGWWNRYVLATDYNTTAVMLLTYVSNGYPIPTWSEFQVLVKNATAGPNETVVNQALSGFCTGDFLDLSSNYYRYVPNNSSLACFTA